MKAIDKAIKTLDMPFNNSSYNHKSAMEKAKSIKTTLKAEAGKISTQGMALDELVMKAKENGTKQEYEEIDKFASDAKREILEIINRH